MQNITLLENFINSCVFVHDDSGEREIYEHYSLNPMILGVKICVVDTTKGFGEPYLDYLKKLGVLPKVIIEPKYEMESVLQNLLADKMALSKLKQYTKEFDLSNISSFFSQQKFADLIGKLSSNGKKFEVHPSRSAFTLTNSKTTVREMASELGVPVVKGTAVHSSSGIKNFIGSYNPKTKFIIKQPSMTAGKGNAVFAGGDFGFVDRYSPFPAVLEYFEDVKCSLTSNWVFWRGKFEHVFTIPQIVENVGYKGNYLPSAVLTKFMSVILEHSLRFSERLQSGFTGVLGYDWIITREGVYLTEINGRWCSTTYPFYFLIKTGVGIDNLFAKSYSVKCTCENLSEFLEKPGFIPLSVKERRGILLFNPLYDFKKNKVTQFTYLCIGRTQSELDKMVGVINGFL